MTSNTSPPRSTVTSTSEGAAKFRGRVLRLLVATVWPRLDLTRAGELERLARMLGVQPDLLEEASALHDREKRAEGLRTTKGVKRTEKGWPQLELDFPERVYDDWLTWCEMQAATPNALARGIIHQYLLGEWEPESTGSTWFYKGKSFVLSKRQWEEKHRRAWPFRERILVTEGVRSALHFRAARKNVSTMGLLRGLVLEALEGRLAGVRPMDARSMFEDPLRYTKQLLPEAPNAHD